MTPLQVAPPPPPVVLQQRLTVGRQSVAVKAMPCRAPAGMMPLAAKSKPSEAPWRNKPVAAQLAKQIVGALRWGKGHIGGLVEQNKLGSGEINEQVLMNIFGIAEQQLQEAVAASDGRLMLWKGFVWVAEKSSM